MASNNTSLPVPDELDLRTTFMLYKSSLKNFLEVCEVEDEKKRKGIFLLSLKKELEELLQRLCTQDELEEMSCAELLTQLERVLQSDDLLLQYTAEDKPREQTPRLIEPTPSGSRDVQLQDTTQKQIITNQNCKIDMQYNIQNYTEREQTAKNPFPFKLRSKLSTFRGRDEYLDKLTATLDKQDCDVVVVHGFSGVGKSELCNQYAWRNIQRYQNKIVWIHAEHLKQELLDLARELDVNTRCTEVAQTSDRPITQITKDVYSQLREKGICLLVLDDVLTGDMIIEFLPGDQHKDIRVLITSPYAYWRGVHTIKLQPLTENESRDILEAALENELDLETQTDDLENLLKIVSGYPLAVQICASYITYVCRDGKFFKLSKYVDKLENKLYNIEDHSVFKFLESSYDKTIYISLETTIEKIEKIVHINSNLFNTLTHIYNVCAYLNAEAIRRSLLINICKIEDLDEAIRILVDFSLVQNDGEQVRMHKLIQKAIILHQEKINEHSKWYQKVFEYFLEIDECHHPHTACVFSHAQNHSKLIYELFTFSRDFYRSKLLTFLVSHDCISVLMHIFEQVKSGRKIKKLVKGSNLMHVAVRCNHLRMVEHLIKYADKLDRLEDEGLSPLLVAAARGLEDVAELLLSRGAKMRMTGYSGVIEVGYGKNPASASWTNKNGDTLLHLAALYGHVGLCKHSLAAPGCNANVINKSGLSPIHVAADLGLVHVLRCLLEVGGVTVDIPGGLLRSTALMEAAWGGHTEAVRCLLEHGASIQARNAKQCSALHLASWNGNADTAALLAAVPDCEVNALDYQGRTPLHMTAVAGNFALVRVLCAAGARCDVRDHKGHTPLDRASHLGHTKVRSFLKERFP